MAPPHLALNRPSLPIGREAARKGLHLAAAVLPVSYALGAPRGALIAVLGIATALALSTERARHASPAFAARFDRVFGPLLRPHERRAITGATWLMLSCFLAVTVFSRNAAIAALWCATVGDPVATLVGRNWAIKGEVPPVSGTGKTIPGTLGCAAASFAGVWMVAGYQPLLAAAVAVTAAIAEMMPLAIDDNVRVAGAAGLVAQLLA